VTDDQKSGDHGGSGSGSARLSNGQTVGSHYVVTAEVPGPSGAFFGRDKSSEREVVLIPVSADHAQKLAAAKGLDHAHLGTLLDIVEVAGDKFAVAARVPGQTLAERLAAIGKKPAVDAVRSALRVSDALNALHEVGAVHGFVHADSVVMEPTDREPPVLAFYPAGSGEPLHAPERAPGSAPSVADDAWAAAGLLHWMLTGAPPRASGYSTVEELEAAGVAEEALRTAILPTLVADPTARQTNLRPLRRELARWFVEHAGEEPIPEGRHSHTPPPLPASMRPGARAAKTSLPPPRPPKLRRILAFTAAAIALGLVAGGVISLLRPKRVEIVERAATVVPEPGASAVEVKEALMAATPTNLGSKLAACTASYLPKGAFGKAPDVAFLCTETDPRIGAGKLHAAVVSAATKGGVPPTDAMKIFARIGWYDMAAFAVVRAGCCPEAPPISLPDSQCGMDASLRAIGEAVIASKPTVDPLKAYTDSIHCELNRGGAKWLRRSERPAGGEDTAFLELLKNLE
jgi:hypothetical protein